MTGPPQRQIDPQSSRPIGSSVIISIAAVGAVLLILVVGSLVILNRLNSNDDNNAAIIPSPSGTSELVQLNPTHTPAGVPIAGAPTETATRDAATQSPVATGSLVTATPTEESVDEPTATDEIPTEVGVDPTATDEVIDDPTATDIPAPTATELPFEGAFGFLPPAQLPSGGVASTLELEYQLGMSLEALPASGTVNRITWPVYTLDDVEFARDRLGLQASVVEEGVGVYRVESDRGTLFVSPTEIVFRAAGFSEGSDLPDDASAISIARNWVDLSGFIGGSMDSGTVVGRDEDIGRVVVKFRPGAPQPNLAPNPSATVNIGPGSTVIEVHIAWPASLEASEYGYSDPLDVWKEIQNGQGYLEADITSVLATGFLTGVATITDYSTAYTLAGNPGSGQYLVPLITFHGTARIDQTGDEIPVYVSIPVVYYEEGTAG